MNRFARQIAQASALAAILLLSACGEEKPTVPSGTCGQGSAQIGIYDTTIQNLCGCDEAAGTIGTIDAPLNCTVPAGTTVTFRFIQALLQHQIITSGSPSFPASPVSTTADSATTILVYPVLLSQPGVYHFSDAFNSAIQGQITVR